MYLCVKYNVNGQEFWDNNGGSNFKVGFQKKYLRQNGKRGFTGARSRVVDELPRSTRRGHADTLSRSKSAVDRLAEAKRFLDDGVKYSDDPVPTRHRRHNANSRSEDFTSSTATSNRAFGQRYDFDASLHEAKQSARTRGPRKPLDVNENNSLPRFEPPAHSPSGNDSPTKRNYTYEEIVNRFCFVSGLSNP
jgi:hypothetical protein